MAKIHLSTLEEDFKKIGLLPTKNENTEVAAEEASTEDTETETAEDAATVEGEEGGDEAITERVKRIAKRFAAGSKKRVKTKKTSADKKRKNKKYRKTGKAKVLAKRREVKNSHNAKKVRRAKSLAAWHAKHDKKESTELSPTERIMGLIENVRDITAKLDESTEFNAQDALKGFAQIALISDKLAERVAALAEESQDESMAELSNALSEMAEEAADSAESLKTLSESEGEEIDGEAVEADFKGMMEAMLDALDIYAELSESDEEGDEAVESDESDEDGEEIEEGSDSDEDEDEDEEDEEGDEEESDEDESEGK